MAASADPGHFFQTTTSLKSAHIRAGKSSNTLGSPLHLSSKPLALIADPTTSDAVYVAESAGTVRRVLLDVGSISEVFRSPASTAPLTSLALSTTSSTIFAGSWDKSIHSWSLITREPTKRLVGGHTDFVKCLLTISLPHGGRDLLLSGGADGTLVLWDAESGARLKLLRTGHTTGGLLTLALLPTDSRLDDEQKEQAEDTESSSADTKNESQTSMTIFSAGSDRTIRRFSLSYSNPHAGRLHGPSLEEIHPEDPIVAHETSVNWLTFACDSQLWTASADETAKCLVPDPTNPPHWKVSATLQHGGYVRAVAVDTEGGLIITAGRSEEVTICDAETGELEWSYEGHYDEITGLVVLEARREVVSISVDGTVRRWGLNSGDIAAAKQKAREEEERRERGEGGGVDNEDDESVSQGQSAGVGLTEEEERELAELMEED